MIKYVFYNVEDLDEWRNRVIERTGSAPRITAKIHGGKRQFTSVVRY